MFIRTKYLDILAFKLWINSLFLHYFLVFSFHLLIKNQGRNDFGKCVFRLVHSCFYMLKITTESFIFNIILCLFCAPNQILQKSKMRRNHLIMIQRYVSEIFIFFVFYKYYVISPSKYFTFDFCLLICIRFRNMKLFAKGVFCELGNVNSSNPLLHHKYMWIKENKYLGICTGKQKFMH